MAYVRRKKSTKTIAEKAEIKSMGKIKHKKTEVDGIVFDSKMESEYYEIVKQQQANGEINSFELQTVFVLQDKYIIVDGQTIFGSNPDFEKIKRKHKAPTISAIKYKGDFTIHHLDGSIEIIDTKGIATADFKIKEKMFRARYPHLKFSVITYDKKTKEWIDYKEFGKRTRERRKAKSSK